MVPELGHGGPQKSHQVLNHATAATQDTPSPLSYQALLVCEEKPEAVGNTSDLEHVCNSAGSTRTRGRNLPHPSSQAT